MKKIIGTLSILLAVVLPAFLSCSIATATQVASVGEVAAKPLDASPLAPLVLNNVGTTPKTNMSDETELKILKERNLLASEFQNSMLSIIIWSLSAIVSTVLLLVGASLFTSFKLHDKDLQRIKEDYDAKIKIFQSEIDASLAVASRDIAAAQEIRSQQDLDRMLDQASQVRSHFETVRVSLESKFDEVLRATARSDATVKDIKGNVVSITTELRRVESLIWDVKKIPTNFLISCLQGLDTAILSGNDYDIDDFIGLIKESLQNSFIDANLVVDEQLLEFFERRLVKLAVVRPDDEKSIRMLLAQCSVVPNVT
ncbi:hypothetical protein ACFFQ5_27675 [Pseudomonas brassicacearum]|uniref:hypothetical protein n=1 Tax=Pseudomonas brassicacearum TaxID=930166 RepID=UPI00087D7A3F|nr:hypothetical protein [Pseudomonas brassicacearum]KAB0526884.1 hypothetical protein F7R20_10900 [Pseudomonas brassicacearum subsp. brassicacearum]NJP60573.1 hypothetical protein [Pseudomonas brassicacearum]SDP88729.1 hypothetical protein SAMN04490180_3624 [Pseudomonas brassicacearum]